MYVHLIVLKNNDVQDLQYLLGLVPLRAIFIFFCKCITPVSNPTPTTCLSDKYLTRLYDTPGALYNKHETHLDLDSYPPSCIIILTRQNTSVQCNFDITSFTCSIVTYSPAFIALPSNICFLHL